MQNVLFFQKRKLVLPYRVQALHNDSAVPILRLERKLFEQLMSRSKIPTHD